MGFAFAHTASTVANIPNLQSHSLFAAFRSKTSQSLCTAYRTKRIGKRFSIVRAESENGALVTSEKPQTNYGRQYFPLAAVVGQVICDLCFFHSKFCFNVPFSLEIIVRYLFS